MVAVLRAFVEIVPFEPSDSEQSRASMSITCSICCRVMSWNCIDTISLLKPSEIAAYCTPNRATEICTRFCMSRNNARLAERFEITLGRFLAFCSAFSMGGISKPALSNAFATLDWTSAVNDLTSSARVPNSVPALPSLAVSIRVKTQEYERSKRFP